MTGTRISRDTSYSSLRIDGSDAWHTGASLVLYGMNASHPDEPGHGEFIIDACDGTTYKRLRGTPNGVLTWDNKNIVRSVNGIAADDNGNIDLLPIGSYIQFAGNQAPAGFLVCNGGAVSRTTYSALFAIIGTKYGSGDGSTTFNLPNLTDRFLQGSTSVGTVKKAGLPNIAGSLRITTIASFGVESTGCFNHDAAETFAASGNHYGTHIDFDAIRSSSIYGNSSTVQPPALTCLICIKY